DLVEGIYKLMISEINEPVNLGSPDEMSILNFARLVIEITYSQSKITYKPLPENDPRVRQPDISRAKKYLKWQPKVELREGLKKTLAWFEKET
ncbi:unnamed protein product, partial [marine sediment metagenome]